MSKRRLGFGADNRTEHFVVVQSDRLRTLVTVVVAPLDVDGPLYEGDPLVMRVTAREAGAKHPHVVLPYMVTAALLDRFEAAPAGKLSAASMTAVDDLLCLALELR